MLFILIREELLRPESGIADLKRRRLLGVSVTQMVMQEVEQELTAPEQHHSTSEQLRKSVNGHGETFALAGHALSGRLAVRRPTASLERLTQREL